MPDNTPIFHDTPAQPALRTMEDGTTLLDDDWFKLVCMSTTGYACAYAFYACDDQPMCIKGSQDQGILEFVQGQVDREERPNNCSGPTKFRIFEIRPVPFA